MPAKWPTNLPIQMFELPEVPTHVKTTSSVPTVFKHMYNYLEGADDDHFELSDDLADKVNRVVHHPEIHNYEIEDNLHHLKFNYGLHDHGTAHKTELLLHTETMANDTIVNLYKVSVSFFAYFLYRSSKLDQV